MRALFSEVAAYIALAFGAIGIALAGHVVYEICRDSSLRSVFLLASALLIIAAKAYSLYANARGKTPAPQPGRAAASAHDPDLVLMPVPKALVPEFALQIAAHRASEDPLRGAQT